MPYIPTKDADLVTWGLNWATLLNGDPARYGVTSPEAALQQTNYDDFSAAYTLASDPTTRSPTTVAHKDGTKALFLADARALAAIVRANRGVTNDDKIALGLNIPDPVPTPIPQPTSVPNFTILGATPSLHTIQYKDSEIATGKAKPYGVIGAAVFRKISANDPGNFDDANPEFLGVYSKSPMAISIPNGVRGQTAYYWAQWITRGTLASQGKGLVGPLNERTLFVCPSFNPFVLLLGVAMLKLAPILAPLAAAFAVLAVLRGLWFIGQRGKTRNLARDRRRQDRARAASGVLAVVESADFTTPNIDVTFTDDVFLRGIPQYETNTAKLPTSAEQLSAKVIRLVYDTPGGVTSFTIPQNDPAVRSRTGGNAAPGTFLAS